MAAYERATWCTRMCKRVCARVCVCVCARVCMCVISEISTLFRFYAILLSIHTVYICRISDFFVMWDNFCGFMCARNVALCGASDRVI